MGGRVTILTGVEGVSVLGIRRVGFPWNYGLAVLLTALAFAFRLAFLPGDRPILVLFILPTAVAAYAGGLGPGLLSTAITAIASRSLLFEPHHGAAFASRADAVQWTVYCATSALVAWVMDSAYRSGRRAEEAEHRAREGDAQARAAEVIRASEARLRAMFEGAAVGIVEVDDDDRFVAVNGRFCEMLGYAREDLIGTTLHDLTAPEDREITRDLNAKGHAGQLRVFEYDKRYLRRDGTRLWVHVTVSVVRDEAGRFVSAIGSASDITARKRAEEAIAEALHEAEEDRRRLAAVLDALPAGVVITDANGGFTHVNAELERIWGGPPRPRSTDDYREWRGWWPDTGRPIAAPEWALSRALSTGEVIVPGDVVEIEKFDGSGRATIVNAAAPIRDAAGTIVGGVLAEVDITAQKRAESSARDAEHRIRSVVENLPSGLVVADLTTGNLVWNAEALRIHGYAGDGEEHRFVESLVAEHDLRTVAGEPIPVERWPLPRLLAHETFRDYEVLVRNTRLGWKRVFSYSGVILRGTAGEPRLGLLAIRDVTDRSLAEQAVRANEVRLRRFAELVEHAPVLVRNDADEIVVWNEGMEQLYGWPRDEVLGKVSHEVLRTRFPRPLPEILEILTRDGRWEGELVHRHRDGREIIVASVWLVHEDAPGEPGAIVEVNNDITELKLAQQALRNADRRKDEFLAMLSHELRNPLAPIRNSVYVLQRAQASGEQAARARDVIERQTDHLARIVDDLLDVTRVARGKIRLRRDRVDLRGLVARAVEDARLVVESRGVRLRAVLPPATVWADADATRITQIVGNLLANARKFTRSGGEVVVALREVGAAAEISVRDTGAGIDPELLPSLFDAFVQGKRTLARSEGGLGLGLALVKGLVELHGGSVRAHSEGIGKGAEFVVTLPLAGAGVGDAAPGTVRATRRGARHVLVVDDNMDAADSLAEVVGLLGHHVEVAYDGPSAIEKIRHHRPDVVLCDIGLPGMTGYDVAQAIRAAHDGAVRLVAISGYAQPEDVRRATEAGFDAHLSKPAGPEQIERVLR